MGSHRALLRFTRSLSFRGDACFFSTRAKDNGLHSLGQVALPFSRHPSSPSFTVPTVPSLCLLSHVQLCGPQDCSLPDSSVHGILQASILEWIAFSSSRESSPPRDRTQVSCLSCIGRQILYHYATCLHFQILSPSYLLDIRTCNPSSPGPFPCRLLQFFSP